MANSSVAKVFDRPRSLSLAEEKKTFLKIFLPQLIQENNSRTALDVGCGFGYFSRYLKDLGLEVTAFDGRFENVTETRIRNPGMSLFRRKTRTFVLAAKERVPHHIFKIASEPIKTNRYMWYSLGMGRVLEYDGIRKAMKKGVKLFREGL